MTAAPPIETCILSICICTYNRAPLLSSCLESILNIRCLSHWAIETLVVDNNSSDCTRTVVDKFATTAPFSVRYVFEANQGLSAARNRAVKESNGDYLAFIDDDCLLDENWLTVALKIISTHRPAVIGGPYYGTYRIGERPPWFKPEYGDAWFSKKYADSGYYRDFRASGGNMIVRRDVFDLVRFNIQFGMKGGIIGLGEERVLQDQYLALKPSDAVYYARELQVGHTVGQSKMTLRYRARRAFAIGRTHALLDNVAAANWRLLILSPMLALYLLVSPLVSLVRSRKRYPDWRNFYYESVLLYPMRAFGLLVGMVTRLSLWLRRILRH